MSTPRFLVVFAAHSPYSPDRRMSSLPLIAGLRALGQSAELQVLAETAEKRTADVVLFHMNDPTVLPHIEALRRLRRGTVLAFVCDLFDFDLLARTADLVDGFIVPTRAMQLLVANASGRPTLVVPEAIDPIAFPADGVAVPVLPSNRALWFGLAENYYNSFDRLIGALRRACPDFAVTFTAMAEQPIYSELVRETIPFSPEGFYGAATPFSHALLNHLPFDYRVNTFIKSPNKMITALVRGQVPLASATPSYREIAGAFGLQPLLFATPAEFADRLETMDAVAQRADYRLNDVRSELLDLLRPDRLAAQFLSAAGL